MDNINFLNVLYAILSLMYGVVFLFNVDMYFVDRNIRYTIWRKFEFHGLDPSIWPTRKKYNRIQSSEDFRSLIIFLIPLISLAWYILKIFEFSKTSYEYSSNPKITDIIRAKDSLHSRMLKLIMSKYV